MKVQRPQNISADLSASLSPLEVYLLPFLLPDIFVALRRVEVFVPNILWCYWSSFQHISNSGQQFPIPMIFQFLSADHGCWLDLREYPSDNPVENHAPAHRPVYIYIIISICIRKCCNYCHLAYIYIHIIYICFDITQDITKLPDALGGNANVRLFKT